MASKGEVISDLMKRIVERFGKYEGRRLERAADEVPNLERLYQREALEGLFRGDNAAALMTMRPGDFESYAKRLSTDDPITRAMIEKNVGKLARLRTGFEDVPFLDIDRANPKHLPNISGHEGRHRMRALEKKGQPTGLVRLLPRASIREDLPRRTREEAIEALRKELGEKRLVTPEGSLKAGIDETEGTIALPDVYKQGGPVHMSKGGRLARSIQEMAAELSKKRAVLPKEEAEANLRKMLESSVVKDRFYHGTKNDIKSFDLTKRGNSDISSVGGGVYLTPNPSMASFYSKIVPGESGANVMPVYAQVKNPFEYDLAMPFKSQKDSNEFSRRLQEAGYDSIIKRDKDGQISELVVFEPNKIKSAIGNRGTYDTKDPDITKAKGGPVNKQADNAMNNNTQELEALRQQVRQAMGLEQGFSKGGDVSDLMKGALSKVKDRFKKYSKEDDGGTGGAPFIKDKVIQSQIERSAQRIQSENPNLSALEVMNKAANDAASKLMWERVQKPTAVKKFGELKPASYSESKLKRLRSTDEETQRRIQKAQDFLAQKTEPWSPPKPELQAFDRSLIKDALEGFPGVEQSRFPRYQAPRANLSYLSEIYDDPLNRDLIKAQIARGLPLGGETFYASLFPLKMAALDRGIPEEAFNRFVYENAPASARNSIMNEMAVGQFLRDMNARGIELTPENVDRERAAYKAKYGIGLPIMPVHREGVRNVIEGNLNLRDLSQADIPTNYKIPTYGTQKAGDFGKSVVLDVHEARGETLPSQYHPYFGVQGGFGPNEYGLAEGKMLDIAEEMGIPGGMAQAGRWFGGGELTGLQSPRGDALDLLERQAAYTLNGMGIKPTPKNVRNYVLDMVGTGRGTLAPWFSDNPMPDVRTIRKKGGLVEAGLPPQKR